MARSANSEDFADTIEEIWNGKIESTELLKIKEKIHEISHENEEGIFLIKYA